jgi:importin subunit beta-1
MMLAYLRVFACRSATVHGEALLAVSSLIDALGPESEKYLQALMPVIELGLKNYAEESVFANTVTLLGDLARALEAKKCRSALGLRYLLRDLVGSGAVDELEAPAGRAYRLR